MSLYQLRLKVGAGRCLPSAAGRLPPARRAVAAGRPFAQLQQAGMKTVKLDEVVLQGHAHACGVDQYRQGWVQDIASAVRARLQKAELAYEP